MSFLLRATLVIGALSYFALQREGGDRPAAELQLAVQRQGESLTVLAGSLQSDVRNAAAQAATAAILKRLPVPAASRDTLLAADRRPEWRGGELR